MSYVCLNSEIINASEAKVSVFDRGFAYGDALFETVKVIKGKPVFLRDHYERLKTGIRDAGFGAVPVLAEISRQAMVLAQENEVEQGRLRILVTRGGTSEPTGPDPAEGMEPTLLLTVETFQGFPAEIYETGVAVATVEANRGRYASLKSSGLMGAIMARKLAHDAGAQEAILTSGHGRILEGAYSNIFFLAENLLVTAAVTDSILPGVTRQKIIDIAPDLGLVVEEHAPKLEALGFGETSAFLTSSLLGVCPVSEINATPLRLQLEVCGLLADRLGALELMDIESILLP
ncbi:MAG: aminotransferase class IV [Thermoleophilia bacterium]